MKELIISASGESGIASDTLYNALKSSISEQTQSIRKVLLLPPDITRMHSGAGIITALYYEMLKASCKVDIMPALGTHEPMSEHEIKEFFGENIPLECFINHNWREDVVKIGEIPGEFVKKVSEGLMEEPIDVEVNKLLVTST